LIASPSQRHASEGQEHGRTIPLGDHAQHIDGQIVANENCSWKDGGEL